MIPLLAVAALSALIAPPSSSPPVTEGFLPGVDGVRLFYRTVGNGTDLAVFLHGGPGSNFRGSGTDMDPLGRSRTLVMYDQRGSGRSQVISDRALLTADHHVRDLEAVRQHFGAERMSLIGLSWGSGLAALYAAKHPERVARLLLVSPMAPTRAAIEERRVKLTALLGEAGAARQRQIREKMGSANDEETVALCREFSDLTFRLYLADPAPEKLRHAQARCDIPPAGIRNRLVVERATMESLGQWDFGPLLAKLEMPALVLEGTETQVPLEPTREWARRLPQSRLLMIPRAGHELFVDESRAFLEAAEQFLSGTYPSAAQRLRAP